MELKDLIKNKLNVSISQFSKEAKISRMTIYNILNDKFEPSLVTTKKICEYFGVDHRDYI